MPTIKCSFHPSLKIFFSVDGDYYRDPQGAKIQSQTPNETPTTQLFHLILKEKTRRKQNL